MSYAGADEGQSIASSPRLAGRSPRIDSMPIQEVIITLVGEYVPQKESVWSGGMVRLLSELGFSDTGARVGLGRVAARGLLSKSKSGRRVFYYATPRMQRLLSDGHRQTFWFRYPQEPWNGRWTLIWYAIPEHLLLERRRLSRRLSFIGFTPLQDRTWIAAGDRANDVRDIIDGTEIEPYIVTLVGDSAPWADELTPFEIGWDLEELGRRYKAFTESYGPFLELNEIAPRDAYIIRAEILELFRQIAGADPKVWDDRLGPSRERETAIETFNQLDTMLRGPAVEFVDEVTVPTDV